ncbi:MAG: phospho-sugar mutase [Oribacterium sp.]
MDGKKEYARWCEKATGDQDVRNELKAMASEPDSLEDAFYRDLEFGTGGLRGVIGAGTNRMNIYTVAKASQGLANYINKNHEVGERRIAISYDSRIKSELFSREASEVFAANGIEVYVYSELMPTPCLSYAVRHLKCAAGVMITASHNPSRYNGYKVYGSDGCQITTEAAGRILNEIRKLDIFEGVKKGDFEEGLRDGKIRYISDDVNTSFVETVKRQSVLSKEDSAALDRTAAMVYTPLNGTGLKPVLRTLRESGYSNITVVAEQEKPDGSFPTCSYPNPEIREAMQLGIEYAERHHAELLIATDPDCDRCGIAVKDKEGGYRILTGNETGILLLDYICSQRVKNGTMPENPIFIKTIVTMDLAERIAARYGVKTINVLTGFKFIGEQIGFLENNGREHDYICGFEESCGYLTGSYVRDKDAVGAAFLICEMFAYYRQRGISLVDRLAELYAAYGYCRNTLHFYTFEGAFGLGAMRDIMCTFRGGIDAFGEKEVEQIFDYSKGIQGLPRSDVLKYQLADNCSVVIRPSGTEPKLKVYISVSAENEDEAGRIEAGIKESVESFMQR